jgi:hypothetical protein
MEKKDKIEVPVEAPVKKKIGFLQKSKLNNI